MLVGRPVRTALREVRGVPGGLGAVVVTMLAS
jgi:hypothetical protein